MVEKKAPARQERSCCLTPVIAGRLRIAASPQAISNQMRERDVDFPLQKVEAACTQSITLLFFVNLYKGIHAASVEASTCGQHTHRQRGGVAQAMQSGCSASLRHV